MRWRFAHLLFVTPGIRYKVARVNKPINAILPLENFLIGESCGNLILPDRYKTIAIPIIHQMPMKISLFTSPHCFTRSALDKNLIAMASSRKPKTTFTEFNHPPDFGIAC